MKPQELRIGDYVRLKESGEVVRLEEVRQNGVVVNPDKRIMVHGYYRYFGYLEIEPIPIADICGRLPYICGLEWADKAAHKGVYLYRGVLLTALHELQNIHYALTGGEIEIEP